MRVNKAQNFKTVTCPATTFPRLLTGRVMSPKEESGKRGKINKFTRGNVWMTAYIKSKDRTLTASHQAWSKKRKFDLLQ